MSATTDHRTMAARLHPSQGGATLIEVLVSFLIVSFGMLALLALQNNAIQFTKTTEYRSLATMLATDLAERMRANRPGVLANAYELTAAYAAPQEIPELDACNGPCAAGGTALAAQDLAEWQRLLFINLPGGAGYVTLDAAGEAVNVWVAWNDPGGGFEIAGDTGGNVRECPVAFVAANADNPPRCAFFRIVLPPA